MSSTERSVSVSPTRTPGAVAGAGARAGAGAGAGARAGAGAGAGAPGTEVRHPRSFKLRFAAQRVPGHSYQSAVRPLALPALVTDKFWSRVGREEESGGEAEARAIARVRDMFDKGPREKHERPTQSSHEYGWWHSECTRLWAAPRADRRLQHHLRDSAWLQVRLRVLAEAPPVARKR